jgi:DNA mismatch repair protein MutH
MYNPNDKDSIISFAKLLVGKSVGFKYEHDIPKLNLSSKDKGRLGKVIEELYFKYKPNTKSEADFKKAGLELKSAGLSKQKRKGNFVAKERLVLNIINYETIVKQNFENDFLTGKNAHLLLVFYLYEQGVDIIDSIIKIVGDWPYTSTDLEIIKKDWEFIKQKVSEGKAHELSEGDTFYLGACTKGANALSSRKQPFSEIPAKQRAYSLKQGYVNHIIASLANDSTGVYGKLIKHVEEIKYRTIEEIVIERFNQYFGLNVDEISRKTGVVLSFNDVKNFYSKVSNAIFNIELDKEIEEFEKANIEIKTIRVESNDNIIQSISFPAFRFEQIYKEDWVTSEMNELVEKKFLFIFFKNDGNSYRLERVKFWNMPLKDRKEVRKVWLNTKKIIQEGRIFKDFAKDKLGNIRVSKKGNPIRLNNLPKINDNFVCHVRPHGSDSTETFPLPVEDKILKVKEYSKQCFWLKNTYVRDEIYLK